MKKPTIFKSFLYLINDISNTLLEKERVENERNFAGLQKLLIFVIVLLIISIGFNIYLIIK